MLLGAPTKGSPMPCVHQLAFGPAELHAQSQGCMDRAVKLVSQGSCKVLAGQCRHTARNAPLKPTAALALP